MSDEPKLPNITESRPDEERLTLLGLVTQEAADYLGLSLDTNSPEQIVAAVNDCVRAIKKDEGPAFPEDAEVDLLLGCLWGSQLVRAFGWEWANITFHEHGDSTAVGVVSPTRDMAIYPFHFVCGCIENRATVTILLSFNMLKERLGVPTYPDCSYENVMDHVHHIVPPDE
jgi:hypothetical protein